jgi:hypothetical protein
MTSIYMKQYGLDFRLARKKDVAALTSISFNAIQNYPVRCNYISDSPMSLHHWPANPILECDGGSGIFETQRRQLRHDVRVSKRNPQQPVIVAVDLLDNPQGYMKLGIDERAGIIELQELYALPNDFDEMYADRALVHYFRDSAQAMGMRRAVCEAHFGTVKLYQEYGFKLVQPGFVRPRDNKMEVCF